MLGTSDIAVYLQGTKKRPITLSLLKIMSLHSTAFKALKVLENNRNYPVPLKVIYLDHQTATDNQDVLYHPSYLFHD